MHTLIICLSILALLLVIFEETIHINKAKSTLFLGCLCWLIFYIFPESGFSSEQISESLNENLLEIASLWLFLMSAMTFVAYLNSRGFISSIVQKALPSQVSEKALLIYLGLGSFVFSSLADNITATLVSVAVITQLKVPIKKQLKYAALVIFSVNSGGVSLITGDVTTLMIFLADKVTIVSLLQLIVPALAGVLSLAFLLSSNMSGHVTLHTNNKPIEFEDKIIGLIFLTTIAATLSLNVMFQVPPVLTFLFGLSIMFLCGHFLSLPESNENVLNYIRKIEFDTLLFFLGILLIVGALKKLHVLDHIALIYQHLPTSLANYLLGISSALVDNVPLTAAVLKANVTMRPDEWLSVTYAMGVGGSLLVIGSAAGIIAMSKIKGLSFISYLSMFLRLLIAYSVGYWLSVLIA
ncbi:sodium:proton antiporter NhaD [Aestuariibacter sp. AA17]|uniref:Sodium:proton antiporter NhaD n=1 Tax=Fluctibacter corallii TaxID=2984329 RepID=A0ABT3AAG3_9ALTE|nr:sodium:proton antiporter NhaD [Aestuariibacter sp. AA17]MCV2885628.1 sodium:proton antiporter NhaD [Aestuariibacter sp. AA17]